MKYLENGQRSCLLITMILTMFVVMILPVIQFEGTHLAYAKHVVESNPPENSMTALFIYEPSLK